MADDKTKIAQMDIEIEKLWKALEECNERCRKLQEALNKERKPEGEREEAVAAWLRERGFTVTKNT